MKTIEDIKNKILCGDSLEVLKEFPDESIDCVITSPPYWCYSDDTEVLTKDGWKLIKYTEIGESVLTLNPITKKIYYEIVTDKIVDTYNGKMVSFKSRDIDLLVTPNHKMYVQNYDGTPIRERKPFIKKENLKSSFLKEAIDVKKSDLLCTQGFIWKGNKQKYFILPKCIGKERYTRKTIVFGERKFDMIKWLRFFGFWLADGSVRGSKKSQVNTKYGISIK